VSKRETSIGGQVQSFQSTIWSDIRGAGDPDNPQHQEKLASLLRTYWRPVYVYVRKAWHRSVEDAKDLTQSFFSMLLEKGHISHIRQEQGSFRGYLKRALKNFLINAREYAEVRGRYMPTFSLDAPATELELLGLPSPSETPDQAFDREWFRSLFCTAVEELRARLHGEGKEVYFRVFETYCFQNEEGAPKDPSADRAPTYRQLGSRLGIKETDVRNYLSYCRREVREILRAKVRDYVQSEEDVDAELTEGARS